MNAIFDNLALSNQEAAFSQIGGNANLGPSLPVAPLVQDDV
jgi:hypothetical protein